jgi:multidrug efflux pump subunit AcrA (membrane-fusion protein)
MTSRTPSTPGDATDKRTLPAGPSWSMILSLSLAVIVALTMGVIFSAQIRSGLTRAGSMLRHHDHEASASGQHWTCGMHPWVILPQEGDCPICHMKLVPLDPSRFTDQVAIAPQITQRIGVRTTPAVMSSLTRAIHTTGHVDYDESLQAQVTLKYQGWIEKLHVSTTGQHVRKGDPLFDIYAPAVYVAQEEYLTVLRTIRRGDGGGSSSDNLLQAARRRLEFLDLTADQIHQLEQRGTSEKTITVYSPADGVVVDRQVTLGSAVEPGQVIYRIADLSRVWVQAAVYEQHLPWIKPGMAARVKLPYATTDALEGKLEYLYPYVDEVTRQGRARLVFDNPSTTLRPGMFVAVELQVTLPEKTLTVPRSAVLDTGERQLLFVALGQGHFEPRQVRTGLTGSNGMLQILDGVTAGEEIVTSGQFLLDTESNTRLALAQMLSPESESDRKASERMPLTAAAAQQINRLIDQYLVMSDQLASSNADVAAAAREIHRIASALEKETMPGQPHFWHEHPQIRDIARHAQTLTESRDIDATRLIFRELSEAALTILKATGVPDDRTQPVEQLDCSMYLEGQAQKEGGSWITIVKEVRNPYFGRMMLRCYTGQSPLPVARVVAPASSHAHEDHP